ncbi:MAG TPA: CcoQ/FixQ family Cbb3-type cytochrome c oxidase assembly chaperone [Ferruginibacter sp.]|nr:CcoQ/FixQ family Cbb3-type cytochrome c oxidase assembly chaperone [Ferruginibacter sp.]HRN80062.1 CcoQ/FixQ family Cbb3-type cytochrome c oxidase assembly chaperone [Ferruginibacter sp.]HRO17662.1 CcoQ/FixQ family Cbb3-type cytochrome c oxidase assembly chaperone [Ferruginibacter sp.]HRQ20674.1 CcoQ/FixQ family Cbb3-type cytochrome c oxidase assembly chaperone [Ferruginibacter sp.]
MFKFIKQYTETIAGAEIYPIISLLIFFLFFIVLTVYVLSMKKSTVKLLSEIPLDDDNETTNLKN